MDFHCSRYFWKWGSGARRRGGGGEWARGSREGFGGVSYFSNEAFRVSLINHE